MKLCLFSTMDFTAEDFFFSLYSLVGSSSWRSHEVKIKDTLVLKIEVIHEEKKPTSFIHF